MKAFIRVLKDIALMLTRIIMGVIMVTHGWHRWQNEGITAEANILEHAGIPNPGLMVWLLIGFEVIGGIFLIFGLATPVIGLGLMVLNIGIILTLRSHTFYVHNSGWEYNAVMTIVGLMLMTHGAGRIGLDNLFRTPKDIQPQAEEQPKRPARSLPEEPAHSLPDEWDDTPARGIQLPQETHSKFMAKPHSGLSQ
ncbi:DoxX family protein [Arachnia propionica]|jgi:membrane protein|uniref:DoxX family protein n=1 Tax=Arachnia propionica TaxID=1750 RepID=A0AB37I3F6_9ACTN|nr:DoxX family protein [Arachnia propionica]AFN45148.1 DoxX family protein [Arachnia propionica F0230a]QCT38890.1 DoxX family protein [Arachnia propionica]QUC11493.1 DoxX family protein [Arachnia propionica]QUC13807.1 DoxX family protein [Arachnia propionica]RPA18332.1 DoxX family protein [Arachnia propionica]